MIQYINLTNGIEAIPHVDDYRFIRIQSTACEQKRWDFILQDLDTDLLMNLALGHKCVVYDYGHNGVPRALWQGVEFVRYVLSRRWLNQLIMPVMRGGQGVGDYFDGEYCRLLERTFRKLDYFKHFLQADKIDLWTVGQRTEHDGQYGWYRDIVRDGEM